MNKNKFVRVIISPNFKLYTLRVNFYTLRVLSFVCNKKTRQNRQMRGFVFSILSDFGQ